VYGCDAPWWELVDGLPDFKGLKVSQDKKLVKTHPEIHRVECLKNVETLVINNPGMIGWGGNSGFHAINLAVQWGAAKVILIGYDMRLDKGIHWHGPHVSSAKVHVSNPTNGNVARWRNVVDRTYDVLSALDIVAINCSPISALTRYPKMTVEEALKYAKPDSSSNLAGSVCGNSQAALPNIHSTR
jgi:hypothetical protein